MPTLSLLLALACGAPPTPTGTPLAAGVHEGSTEGPEAWTVSLAAGEVLNVGALSDAVDVELVVQPPAGDPIRAHSARAEHRAADVRIEAAEGGTWGVTVRARAAEEQGELALIRRKPMDGTVCDQLGRLAGGDRWSLPGAEHPPADHRRTRELVDVLPWADRCSVNQLQDLDVGSSCVRTGLTADEAGAAWAEVEAAFRGCHGGWTVTDESMGGQRELTAEKAGNLRFLRLRDAGPAGWELSVGAMPED